MTKKTIVRSFQFRSSRDSAITYSTLLYSDGTASCNCPGWTSHTAKDGSRTCKHLIAAGVAPVSETAHSATPKTAGKPGRHGEAAKVTERIVRRFNFEDE